MRRVLLPTLLGLLVLVLGFQTFLAGGWVVRPHTPPTDLPRLPGHRSVWAHEAASMAVRPDDVVLEIVADQPTPFAALFDNPLHQVAIEARRSTAAVVVTLDGFGYVGRAKGTIREILKNESSVPLELGSTIAVSVDFRTDIRRAGSTQIVERVIFQRAPRGGGQYLLFLFEGRMTGLTASIDYGNGFEIRGHTLVPMSVPKTSLWQVTADADRALRIVRQQAALPTLDARLGFPSSLLEELAP